MKPFVIVTVARSSSPTDLANTINRELDEFEVKFPGREIESVAVGGTAQISGSVWVSGFGYHNGGLAAILLVNWREKTDSEKDPDI